MLSLSHSLTLHLVVFSFFVIFSPQDNIRIRIRIGMVSYHLLMVFKPSLARQQVASVVQQAGRRVFAGGSAESATAPGIVTAVRSHGHRQLAFEVKRHGERYTHGYIMAMEFCAPPEAIPDVRKDLKTSTSLLRFMVTKTSSKPVAFHASQV